MFSFLFQPKSSSKCNPKRIFFTYFGKNYWYRNINYSQKISFCNSEWNYFVWNEKDFEEKQVDVSVTQFLCNQNTAFNLWSPTQSESLFLNLCYCTSQEADASLGYYLNKKQRAWNKLGTEDWRQSMLSSLAILRNSCCDLFYSTKHVKSKLPFKNCPFCLTRRNEVSQVIQ